MAEAHDQARIETFQRTLDRLLSLEALTTGLLTCPEEQMTDRLAERQQIMDEIRSLVEGDAARHAGAGAPQGPADEALQELTAQCRAVACRMQLLDAQAVARMQNIQQRILQKIRTVGKSAGARAARYYTPRPQSSSFNGSI